MTDVWLYDTTLRDGTQGENINFSAEEKIRIAERLDDLGIHFIEGGWPGSNPRDMRFFDLAKEMQFKNARLTSFGSTRKPNTDPAQDPNLQALLQSETTVVTIFGKSWRLHVDKVMGTTDDENLAMISDSVAHLYGQGREVIYDGEHFFDGYKDDPQYALETLMAAWKAGANWIVLCDTNGGCLPSEIVSITQNVRTEFAKLEGSIGFPQHVRIGIHTHNDCGMAVANSIEAIRCGATMVQGTINGYGERTGNADLTAIIPLINLKMNQTCMSSENLAKLKNVSRYVSETANIVPRNDRPFVGRSAFAHKGGIHVNAIMKTPRAYEHIDPELVGNHRRVLVSDLSGRSNVQYKAAELGVKLAADASQSREIVARIKQLEDQGFQYDAAEGSFQILLEKWTQQFKPLFELESFRVTIEKDKDQPCSAHATIKIAVDGAKEITAAEGFGPVSALDNALRKALDKFYPDLDTMRLVDFKVRVIEGSRGTAAKVRVLIDSRDQDRIWSTIGVSEDIIEASWQALADSFQFKLAREERVRSKPVAMRANVR